MKSKSISRRDFMKGCGGCASVLLGSGLLSEQVSGGAKKRANVVLIVSDDHGLDAVGCYGNPVIRTVNLDGLAGEELIALPWGVVKRNGEMLRLSKPSPRLARSTAINSPKSVVNTQ